MDRECKCSYLNRWIQPDTIIPDPNNPQSYDRYSYVKNNPIRYTDPTGHRDCEECGRDDLYDPIYQENYDTVYYENHTEEEREENAQKIETFVGVAEGAISIFSNTADLAFTSTHCIMGDCGYYTYLFAALPIIPGIAGSYVDDFIAVIPTGQWHHPFSKRITDALNRVPEMNGVFTHNDLLIQARDLPAHNGYWGFHENLDSEVVRWINTNRVNMTPDTFLDHMTELYQGSEMQYRFPDGWIAFQLLKQELPFSR